MLPACRDPETDILTACIASMMSAYICCVTARDIWLHDKRRHPGHCLHEGVQHRALGSTRPVSLTRFV